MNTCCWALSSIGFFFFFFTVHCSQPTQNRTTTTANDIWFIIYFNQLTRENTEKEKEWQPKCKIILYTLHNNKYSLHTFWFLKISVSGRTKKSASKREWVKESFLLRMKRTQKGTSQVLYNDHVRIQLRGNQRKTRIDLEMRPT